MIDEPANDPAPPSAFQFLGTDQRNPSGTAAIGRTQSSNVWLHPASMPLPMIAFTCGERPCSVITRSANPRLWVRIRATGGPSRRPRSAQSGVRIGCELGVAREVENDLGHITQAATTLRRIGPGRCDEIRISQESLLAPSVIRLRRRAGISLGCQRAALILPRLTEACRIERNVAACSEANRAPLFARRLAAAKARIIKGVQNDHLARLCLEGN